MVKHLSFFLFTSIILFPLPSFSQNIIPAQSNTSFEIVIGVGHSALSKGTIENNTVSRTDFHLLEEAGIRIKHIGEKHWGYGGGLFLSKEGFKRDINSPYFRVLKLAHNATFIRFPFNFYYQGGEKSQPVQSYAFAGLSLGILITDKEIINDANSIATFKIFDYNPISFGIQAGAGIRIRLSKFSELNCDVALYQGLTDDLKKARSFVINTGKNISSNVRLELGILFDLHQS